MHAKRSSLLTILTILIMTIGPSLLGQAPEDRPLTEQIYGTLRKIDGGKGDGTAYSITNTNVLPSDWLIQTPNVWGTRAAQVVSVPACTDAAKCDTDLQLPYCSPSAPCTTGKCVPLRAAKGRSLCVGASDAMIDNLYDVVSAGGTVVDIATLLSPDGRFMGALRRGVTAIARSGSPVLVRVLIGEPPFFNASQGKIRHELVSAAAGVSGSKLRLTVAVYRIKEDLWRYWNHAKIVANDRQAVVGGHNLWTKDYLLTNVVHDVSMKVNGPAAGYAHRFLDPIWSSVCSLATAASYDATAPFGDQYGTKCLTPHPLSPVNPGTGNVSVLTVGNYSVGIPSAGSSTYMSDAARNEAIRLASKTIRLSQQDLGLSMPWISKRIWWPDETLQALGDALIRGVNVYIVLSNYGAVGGSTPYEYSITPVAALTKIAQVTSTRPNAPAGNQLKDLVCKNLHLATLRFNAEDNVWPTGKEFANHAKAWLVDDRAFYIGSDNIYPAWLQELGYVVDDASAAATMKMQYWDPLWKYSQRTAISGPEAPACQLKCEIGTWFGFDTGWTNKPRGFADVNGDKKADYCRNVGKDVLACAIAQPAEFADNGFKTEQNFDLGWDGPRAFVDANGDGKADYCRFVGKDVLSCALSTGTPTSVYGAFKDGTYKTGENFDAGWTDKPRTFIDVNGDGRSDYCRFVGYQNKFRISCRLAGPDGWGAEIESPQGFDAGWANKPRGFVDINGDGKAAYCRDVGDDTLKCAVSNGTAFVDGVIASGAKFDFGSEPRGFADVNADGKLDYCRVAKAGNLTCAITGTSGFTEGFGTSGKLDYGWTDKPRLFVDINGDHKADFCRVIGADRLQCALSTGEPDKTTGTFNDTFQVVDGFDIGSEPRLFADVVGDRSAAYCRVRKDLGLTCATISVCHK